MMRCLCSINMCTSCKITLLCNLIAILVCIKMPYNVFWNHLKLHILEWIHYWLTALGLYWWKISGNPTEEFKLFQDWVLEEWLPSPEVWLIEIGDHLCQWSVHATLVGPHRATTREQTPGIVLWRQVWCKRPIFSLTDRSQSDLFLTYNYRLLCIN